MRNDSVHLTLLVRAYCHLCDEMRDALRPLAKAAGATITEIDVDADAAIEARFGDLVPVLLHGSIDGIELCHYRLDTAGVENALSPSASGRAGATMIALRSMLLSKRPVASNCAKPIPMGSIAAWQLLHCVSVLR